MKKHLIALLGLAFAAGAQAHEVWIERDGDGPARIYLGEPAEPLPAGGDPEFAKLKAPRLLSQSSAPLVRKAGYLEVQVPLGDVRTWDDAVFAPWGPEGKREGVVYYARAGREETRAALPFEIVPAAPGGGRFLVLRDGRPIAGAAVTLIRPDRSSASLVADSNGAIEAPSAGAGRYLQSATRKEGPATLPGGPVQIVHRITTTTFLVR